MIFGDWRKLSRAVDFAGGCLDKALDVVTARRFEKINRSPDVGFHVTGCRLVGIGNGNERGEMKNHFLMFTEPRHLLSIPNIATFQAHVLANFCGQIVQPTVSVKGIVMGESGDVGATPKQVLRLSAIR